MSRRLLALLAVCTLLYTACSSDSDSDTSTDDSSGEADSSGETDPTPPDGEGDDATTAGDIDAAEDEMADSEMDMGDADDSADSVAPEVATPGADTAADGERPQAEVVALFLGRQIIKTGEVVVEAADVRATTDDIIDTVFANGGAIWGQETESEPTPRTTLTIRVPPLEFDALIAAVTDVPGVGIVSESTTSDDVTEVVIDLDARISAAESSVGRIQALLDEARDLNTIFQLEEELATRQADLERLLGQRKTIGDQIALSTITLTVIELDPDRLQPEMDVVAWLGEDAEDACPGKTSHSMGADDSAVLCVSISNTGEDALTAIDVASPTLRLRVDDFTIADGLGSLDELAPGDELLLTVDLDADGGAVNRVDVSVGADIGVEVTAVPATSESVELTGRDSVFLTADGDDPLPGFGDSLASGWGAMIAVVSVLMIVLGTLIPFLPVIALGLYLGRRYWRREDQPA